MGSVHVAVCLQQPLPRHVNRETRVKDQLPRHCVKGRRTRLVALDYRGDRWEVMV